MNPPSSSPSRGATGSMGARAHSSGLPAPTSTNPTAGMRVRVRPRRSPCPQRRRGTSGLSLAYGRVVAAAVRRHTPLLLGAFHVHTVFAHRVGDLRRSGDGALVQVQLVFDVGALLGVHLLAHHWN